MIMLSEYLARTCQKMQGFLHHLIICPKTTRRRPVCKWSRPKSREEWSKPLPRRGWMAQTRSEGEFDQEERWHPEGPHCLRASALQYLRWPRAAVVAAAR